MTTNSTIQYPTNGAKAGTGIEGNTMTISEAFEAYRIDVVVFKNQSSKTEENHIIAQHALVRFFGDIDVTSLTFEDVRQWKTHLDKTRSQDTVRNYIIKLRVVLGYLRTRGYDVIEPSTIPVPKRLNKPPKCISSQDVKTLIDATPNIRSKAIISLLYSSGIRVSELCSLNRDDLHNKRFTIHGKGNKSRLCFYDTRTNVLLRQYLATRIDSSPALFYTPQGRISPGTVQELFKRLRKKTGIEGVHPHTLRHTFATELMQNGMHIYNIARLMGHNSIQTTQIYLTVSDPRLEEDYRRFFKS